MNHYEALEIDQTASIEVIKAAYTILTQKYNPDKNNSKEFTEKIKVINVAYVALSNPTEKLQYDNLLKKGKGLNKKIKKANIKDYLTILLLCFFITLLINKVQLDLNIVKIAFFVGMFISVSILLLLVTLLNRKAGYIFTYVIIFCFSTNLLFNKLNCSNTYLNETQSVYSFNRLFSEEIPQDENYNNDIFYIQILNQRLRLKLLHEIITMNNDNPKYQFNRGIYDLTNNNLSNKDGAIKWLTKSADQGYLSAIRILGEIYMQDGLYYDKNKALKWLTIASERGDEASKILLFNIQNK